MKYEATEFQYYLKRCVAVAGDTLEVRNKHLFVNGKEEPLAPHGEYDESMPETPGNKWQNFLTAGDLHAIITVR